MPSHADMCNHVQASTHWQVYHIIMYCMYCIYAFVHTGDTNTVERYKKILQSQKIEFKFFDKQIQVYINK